VIDRIDEDNVRLEREARSDLDTTVSEISALGVTARSGVLRGQIPEALDEYAHESRPELLITTTSVDSRLEGALLGSVSEHLLRHAGVPVLLLDHREPAET